MRMGQSEGYCLNFRSNSSAGMIGDDGFAVWGSGMAGTGKQVVDQRSHLGGCSGLP